MKKKNEVRELIIPFMIRSHRVRVWFTLAPMERPTDRLMAGLISAYRAQAVPAADKGLDVEEIARAICCNDRKVAAVEVTDIAGHGMVLYPDWS